MSLLARTLSRWRRRSGACAIGIIAPLTLAAVCLPMSIISGPAAQAATCGTPRWRCQQRRRRGGRAKGQTHDA